MARKLPKEGRRHHRSRLDRLDHGATNSPTKASTSSRSSAGRGAMRRRIFRRATCRTNFATASATSCSCGRTRLTFTFRNKIDQTALPIRNWGAFMPPNGVGGGGVHWNAEMWRFLPSDFVLKTHLTRALRRDFLPADMTIQDWGITYDELEPHYDRFEYLCGTSGHRRQSQGPDQEGGNPFEGPRSRPYPTPAQPQPFSHTLFGKAARELGYKPFPQPSGNLSHGLYQSARAADGSVHLLRILRMVRLQQLFEGQPANHDPARAGPQIELHGARQFRGRQDQHRQIRQACNRRDLRRQQRRGMGAAGRPRDPFRLLDVQRAAYAAFRDRPAVRPRRQHRRDRAQLHPSDDLVA